MTLGEARDKLRELVEDGEHCPCCTQFAKVYKRRIHASMAATLIRMYRAVPPEQFMYLPDIPQKARDCTFLRYWDLIAEESVVRPDGGRAGWWRVTREGHLFVRGEVFTPKYARVYDGRCLGFEGDAVSIHDCLGKKFNYRELMEGV
jgi:hypothetical protein